MIGVFESKFLLVTVICSVPILSVLTVKIIITRRALGSNQTLMCVQGRVVIQNFKYLR